MRRVVVRGELVLEAPFAVGSGELSLDSDRPLLTGPAGVPALPGSSLAGSLRGLLERLAPSVSGGADLLRELFGTARDETGTQDAEAGGRPARHGPRRVPAPGGQPEDRPSRVWVADAEPLGEPAPVSLRDGVGIHRGYGAARQAVKYDLEVAGHGARYRLDLTVDLRRVDDPDAEERLLAMLALGLEEWRAGRGSVGGRAGSGLGAFRLENVSVCRIDLGHRDTLRAWLRARPRPGDRADGLGQPCPLPAPSLLTGSAAANGTWPGWLRLSMRLRWPGPLLVGGPTPVLGGAADAEQLTRPARSGPEPVLPGSSVRGALRTRCERIARTLGIPACDPLSIPTEGEAGAPGGGSLPPGPRAIPGQPLAWHACGRWLAGFESQESLAPGERAAQQPERAARLREAHCVTCRLFGSTMLGGRVRVAERALAGEPELLDHVAVDRFTGGVAGAKRFDSSPLLGASTLVTVEVDRPGTADLAVLLLALRDLAEGWVPVGSRATRGSGRAAGTLERVEVRTVEGAPLAPLCGDASGAWRTGEHPVDGWDALGAVPGLRAVLDDGMRQLRESPREGGER